MLFDRSEVVDFRRWVRRHGAGPVAALVAGKLADRAGLARLRRYAAPSLDQMLDASGQRMATSADEVVAAMQLGDADGLRTGFAATLALLDERRKHETPVFPPLFASSKETLFLLYALVRLLVPDVTVETGVADGVSSFVILSALEANGRGHLHSFDVVPDAGRLVGTHPRWTLTISDGDPDQALAASLDQVGTIDLFFHDSDHRYFPQLSEYRRAWAALRPGGVLVSDDVDDSQALLVFCRQVDRQPTLLFDERRVVGAVRA